MTDNPLHLLLDEDENEFIYTDIKSININDMLKELPLKPIDIQEMYQEYHCFSSSILTPNELVSIHVTNNTKKK